MISKRVVLHFPRNLVNQPVISKLVRDWDLECNILRAKISPSEEGLLVLELKGDEKKFDLGIDFLREIGLGIEPLSLDIVKNKSRCKDCGVCVPLCPSGALETDPVTRKVSFYDSRCVVCEFCVRVCPFRAMEVKF